MHNYWTSGIIAASLFSCEGTHQGSCFICGTLIKTKKGEKAIESIAVGDEIWSWNVNEKKMELRQVEHIHRTSSTKTYSIQTIGAYIMGVTGTHPIYCPTQKKWVLVKDLKEGDSILVWGEDGSLSRQSIQSIHTTHHTQPVPVYTLTIAGAEQNYFAQGVLVHNKSVLTTPPEITITSPAEGDILEEGFHVCTALIYDETDEIEDLRVWWFKNDEVNRIEGCDESFETSDITCEVQFTPDDTTIHALISDPNGEGDVHTVSITVLPIEDEPTEEE